MSSTPATRPYRMVRRAEVIAETRKAIIDAVIEIEDVRMPLSAVARAAGVSERTVLRQFGSRDGLVAAVIDEFITRVEAERFSIPAGDVAAAVAEVVGYYEVHGDAMLRLLADEGVDPLIDEFLAKGREVQRRWIKEKLGPLFRDCDALTRRRRTAQLVAVCGVYVWKLLRRDGGLGRSETERALRELIDGVIDSKERPS